MILVGGLFVFLVIRKISAAVVARHFVSFMGNLFPFITLAHLVSSYSIIRKL